MSSLMNKVSDFFAVSVLVELSPIDIDIPLFYFLF